MADQFGTNCMSLRFTSSFRRRTPINIRVPPGDFDGAEKECMIDHRLARSVVKDFGASV